MKIAEELRAACAKLRVTPMPLADLIPLLQRAADRIAELEAVVGDACDWVGVLDATEDSANHALRKQWIVRARAALKGKP